ncbi:GM13508 [Drosophila sechellia]|uniref:GM13508 n=1 Tax=Drosophila sechellia TaxID=7238 RepID=B4IF08_DROSE|nr:GM13508 [Drosophila sechellia]
MGNRESNSGARSVVATDNDALDFGHCDDDDDDAVVCGRRDSSRHGHMSSTMSNRQKWAEISERSDDDELGIVVLVAERFISLNGKLECVKSSLPIIDHLEIKQNSSYTNDPRMIGDFG